MDLFWSKETPEKINYTKLCRLLVDGGTQAVRSVFDGIHSPYSLTAILNANKTTLQKLKKPKGKVLNNEQWDKLYPPSGINPTSKDFDITLLFVLIRNICSLTPPVYEITSTRKRKRSWDELPHKTDNSLEANLARIKYYRNNTIAHKPNTEINDVDFEQYWLDISSALLTLGLNQKDMDDLKSVPLGENTYNQLLYDWYISVEDIKIQLDDLKSNTVDVKTDTTAIKSDTTAIKSDTTAIKTDATAIKTDTTAIKTDTTAIKTDTTAIKTDTTAIKTDATAIKTDTTAIKTDAKAIKTDTALIPGIKDDMSEIKINVMNIQKKNQHVNKLAKSEFNGVIESLCKSYHQNSRQWILDQVKSHVDSDQPESCIMVITAVPGMGKSTTAAKICEMYENLGCLGGCHFFQFSNSTRNNPRLMLQSIASQMCDTVPGYRDSLETKLQTNLGKDITEMNCEELFTVLLEEPLHKVKFDDTIRKKFVVVLDAIDECCSDLKYDLQEVLRDKLSLLPSWLRFVITTRPPPSFSALQSKNNVVIDPKSQQNKLDLEKYFKANLENTDDQSTVIEQLVEMSDGLFLVAFFFIDHMQKEKITSPSKVIGIFPNGISSVYEKYFERVKTVLSQDERFFKMLNAIVASKDPIPIEMVYSILGLEGKVPRTKRKTKIQKYQLNLLHSLFPVENDHVTVFHKSVVDWLILEGDKEHEFSVRVEEGNEVLVNKCYDVLSNIRNGNKDLKKPLDLTDSEKYALQFVLDFIDSSSAIDEGEKIDRLSNLYIITAIISEDMHHAWYDNHTRIISDQAKKIIRCAGNGFYNIHDHSIITCPFYRLTTFGGYLEFVLHVAHAMGVTEETTPKPLDALKKHQYPYYDRNTVFVSSEMISEICICKNGFIALCPTAIYKYQLDGSYIRSKSFVGNRKITTSPNTNFIVVTEEIGNKIEIVDLTTLDVIKEYESPHDEIQTCHVFGDDRCWYIVIKGCNDDKVHVIEGLTGRLRNTITVNEDSEVSNVSCQGHIVITKTLERRKSEVHSTSMFTDEDGDDDDSEGTSTLTDEDGDDDDSEGTSTLTDEDGDDDDSEGTSTFTDKDGNTLEIMNWEIRRLKPEYAGILEEAPSYKYDAFITYRKLFLYHYDRAQESIPIYPLAEKICKCRDYDDHNDGVSQISQDGSLLAYHYYDSIFVFNTSDGSLFKRCSFTISEFAHKGDDGVELMTGSSTKILFVSECYIIMYGGSVLFVFNVEKNKIEHQIFLPCDERRMFFPCDFSPTLLIGVGEPFTLLFKGCNDVSHVAFHNLEFKLC